MCSSCTLGLPRKYSKVHDTGVQGPECSGGGRTVTLPAFPLGKVHQGKSKALFYLFVHLIFLWSSCNKFNSSALSALFLYCYYWYFFNLTLKYPANAKILPFFMQGDECQLKHVQVYNGLIKELCKFYVSGFCMKAESCPYMHNILSLFYCYMSQTKVCWTIHELCCSFGP